MWTRFMDMHSGGGCKLPPYENIYIELPMAEAVEYFKQEFNRDPDHVTCGCCGQDYSVSQSESLEQLTGRERNCQYAYLRPDGTECAQDEAWMSGVGMLAGYASRYIERQSERNIEIRARCNTPASDSWGIYIPLDEYVKRDNVLVVSADKIGFEWPSEIE